MSPYRCGEIPLSLAALPGVWLLEGSSSREWLVDAEASSDGEGTRDRPFASVMEAVAAAADGDTILVAPGTYRENVLLEKDLTLIGLEGADVTRLDGCSSGKRRPNAGCERHAAGLHADERNGEPGSTASCTEAASLGAYEHP